MASVLKQTSEVILEYFFLVDDSMSARKLLETVPEADVLPLHLEHTKLSRLSDLNSPRCLVTQSSLPSRLCRSQPTTPADDGDFWSAELDESLESHSNGTYSVCHCKCELST